MLKKQMSEQPQQSEDRPDDKEQELYNRFVLAGVKAITASSDQIMQMLQQKGDPAEFLSKATLTVVSEIYAKMKSMISKDILFQGSIEILKNVAQFGKDSNIIPTDDAVMNRAAQFLFEDLLDQFGDDQDYQDLMDYVGSVDPEEAERMGAEQEQYAMGYDDGANR
jgi:hypothetical protein